MKRLVVFFLIIVPLFYSCNKPKNNFKLVLPSPDSRIHIYFNLDNGEPYYLVYYKNKIIIDWSLLGVTLKNQIKLSEGLFFVKNKAHSNSSNDLLILKGDLPLTNNFNEMTVFFEKKSLAKEPFAIVLRAYNDGIAICYSFPENESEDKVFIITEETQFDLYGNDSVWRIAESNKPGGDSTYIPESGIVKKLDLPLNLISADGLMIAISETEVSGYPEMKLRKRSSDTPQYTVQSDELKASEFIAIDHGVKTPWRTIKITEIDGQ
jgi:glucan 1,4-alpha-glucosidase